MEHVVFYPSADGSPAFRRVTTLDDAMNFVEHLRNVEGVTDFSVHALTAVPLAFRAYYHVEVPAGSEPVESPVDSPESEVAQPDSAQAELAPVDSAPYPDAPVAEAPAADAPAEPAAVPSHPSEFAAPIEAPAEAAEAPVTTSPAPIVATPFADAPPVAAPAPQVPVDAFVKDAPLEATDAPAEETHTDPSVEEVVPIPTGRRSMGFFARS